MQVLPDDLRNQRIVVTVVAARRPETGSGSTPSSFRAAMATWSRTSGCGSRAQLDHLVADRRLDSPMFPAARTPQARKVGSSVRSSSST